MKYAENELICKCKRVTFNDIEKALHNHKRFESVEQEFDEVQKETKCSTGCGKCHNKIMDVISQIISG